MAAKYPDCQNCEAPCCRRQFIDDDAGWFNLAEARELYRAAGTTVKVVGWHRQRDGRQPMLECQAFDVGHLRCSVYAQRPEHCRVYDCREDDPDEWEARPHCDVARHRRMEARRARSNGTTPG